MIEKNTFTASDVGLPWTCGPSVLQNVGFPGTCPLPLSLPTRPLRRDEAVVAGDEVNSSLLRHTCYILVSQVESALSHPRRLQRNEFFSYSRLDFFKDGTEVLCALGKYSKFMCRELKAHASNQRCQFYH